MFASIRYINTHHAASSIPGQQFPIHFPGQTPLYASSLAPHPPPAPTQSTNNSYVPHINGTSNSHTHLNGTTSVPGSVPGTPAALRDGLDTRPQTPNPSNTTPGPSDPPPAISIDGDDEAPPRPDSPDTFRAAIHELSRDLVTKEQRIEFLIRNLPGCHRTVEEQEARIKELDVELRDLEEEVKRAEGERTEMLKQVESVIMGVRRW